jgi:hypothetical protein
LAALMSFSERWTCRPAFATWRLWATASDSACSRVSTSTVPPAASVFWAADASTFARIFSVGPIRDEAANNKTAQ